MTIIPYSKSSKLIDWLMGRIAAKTAVREFYASRNQPVPLYQDIIVKNHDNGEPYIESLPNISISISHSDGFAAAEVIEKQNNKKVGVDIESVRNFSQEFASNFLTLKERAMLQNLPQGLRDFGATLIWSAKESYLKALGLGLRKHPKTVETKLHLPSNTFSIQGAVGWFERIGENNLVTKIII